MDRAEMPTPPSARLRGNSRLAQLLRSSQPSISDTVSDHEEELSGTSSHPDVRPAGEPRPRAESTPLGASVTSSMNQKTPARSYYQRSFRGAVAPADGSNNTPHGVREETAELASWALSDAGSGRSGTPPAHHQSTSAAPTLESYFDDPLEQSNAKPRGSDDSIRPDVIHEVSEPETPVSGPSSRKSISILADMIRDANAADGNGNNNHKDLHSDNEDSGHENSDAQAVTVRNGIISQPGEGTALLRSKATLASHSNQQYGSVQDVESQRNNHQGAFHHFRTTLSRSKTTAISIARVIARPKTWDARAIWKRGIIQPAGYIPAITLGLLLNILDALSYGMILFPLGQPIFASLGPDGISMFYVSCIVSQLVYSLGGSVFKGGIGSEMIEVVPFFHKMAFTIMARVGEDNPKSVIATTILSYSLSSVLTGAVFFLMGKCKLGSLVGFFPRHILIGCIGGVGFFLVATGLEVSARLKGNVEYNLPTLKKLVETDTVFLWVIPLVLALTLLVSKRWVKHSLTDAAFFLSIIVIFYFFVAAIPDLNLEDLRRKGWVFEAVEAGVPFYHFYSLYDFGAVNWTALLSTVPAMFALTFFGILHVPINVPALGLTTGEDNVDVDRELRAHGLSNALSGLCGSIQNYLVYTNTVLFMRSGGDSRVAGVLLACGTFGILVIGPVIIGYIPIMVVGALIFFLGFDLMREALVDTWGRLHRLEYFTIIVIVVTMGTYDFVVGILVGIVLACVSFVVQSSQISAIRFVLPGGLASSTVRRHPIQDHFLQAVGKQIYVMQLAGYLFFGTIVGVENRVRALLKEDAFDSHPIRFLVLDLSKVDGVDFSAAEAFTRINRILKVREVRMIMCGFPWHGEIGDSLYNVGLFSEDDNVEFFATLNSALEFCENELLKAFYQRRDAMNAGHSSSKHLEIPHQPASSSPPTETMFSSPRRDHLHTVATTTLKEQQDSLPHRSWAQYPQPLQLILQTFSPISTKDESFWALTIPYFTRQTFPAGTILYRRGDPPTGFYLLETGILKAEYKLPQGTLSELIVAGTTCGELPFFSETERTATTVVERDCVLWVLGVEQWRLVRERVPEVGMELLRLALRLTRERVEVVTKYMLLSSG